jgi:hypothetical protein
MLNKVKYYINKLNLKVHPEGGFYNEVYRAGEIIEPSGLPSRYTGKRNFSTSIYFLLEGDQKSCFHKLKSDELWHFYDGSPVRIYIINQAGELSELVIGENLEKGELFQGVIIKNSWFAAEVVSKDSYSLIGCTVTPGFEFEDFELGKRSDLLSKYPSHRALIEKFTWG